MQAFCVRLRPPRHLRTFGWVLHAAALMAVLLYGGAWRVLWLAALAVSALWFHLRQRGGGIVALHIDTRGRAALETDEGLAFAVRLRPGSLVTRYLLVLHWQGGDRIWRQALTRDMTDADAWRRLTVWARWAQPTEEVPPV